MPPKTVPIHGTPILQTALDAVKQQMLDSMQEELSKQIIYGSLGPPAVGITSAAQQAARMEVRQIEENRTIRVSLEVSMRELMSQRSMGDIINDTKHKFSSYLAHFLEQEVSARLDGAIQTAIAAHTKEIDILVKASLRDEIKRQVKETVEARIDDFLEEAL